MGGRRGAIGERMAGLPAAAAGRARRGRASGVGAAAAAAGGLPKGRERSSLLTHYTNYNNSYQL